jgi:sugar O-acyltransferase (sialic acid O-acetyltransferase NeuD family)
MKPLVIFGSRDMAELAEYYFSRQAGRTITAFTLDREFVQEATCLGRPVVAFEDLASTFPPSTHDLFVALSYSKMNQLRKQKYLAARECGYTLPSFVSPKATILNDGRIGDNCLILEDNTVQPFVTIGSNVTLWSGNHIGHHSSIEDHVFIASHVVVSGGVRIGTQSFIGVNATLRDHISIGERCVIGAGTLILADTEATGVYIGRASERAEVKSDQLKKL